MNKQKVGLCPYCGFPLISTMAFRYAEKYCMNCRGNFGMFDVNYMDITPKLRPIVTKVNRRFGQVREHLIGGGMRRRDCKKCEEEEHLQHATPEESKKYKWALKKLGEWEGSFGWRK